MSDLPTPNKKQKHANFEKQFTGSLGTSEISPNRFAKISNDERTYDTTTFLFSLTKLGGSEVSKI